MDDSNPTNICRACLTKEGEFKSVFMSDEKSGVNIHLAEMIMSYASVQVNIMLCNINLDRCSIIFVDYTWGRIARTDMC